MTLRIGTRSKRSLRELIDSRLTRDRVHAGRIISSLLDPGTGLVDRKREIVRFHAKNVNERVIELEVLPSRLKNIEDRWNVALDSVPIALVPKGIYKVIELTNEQGDQVALVTRRMNERAARCHLVWLALEGSDGVLGEEVPLEVWELLGRCVSRFPPTYELDRPYPTLQEQAAAHLNELEHASSRTWWQVAMAVPGWSKLLTNYKESFLAIPWRIMRSVDDPGSYRLLFHENRTVMGPRALREQVQLKRNQRLAKAVTFRINQVGRARSDTMVIEAPPGVFISNAWLDRQVPDPDSTEDVSTYPYRLKVSRRDAVIYQRRRSLPAPRAVSVVANLWPDIQGFLNPLRLLGWYTLYATLGLILMQDDYFASGLRRLETAGDAFLSLSFFLPAILVAWIFRADEMPFRRALVGRWRTWAGICVAVLWVDSSLILVGHTHSKVVVGALAANCVIAFLADADIERFARRVIKAHKQVKNLEIGPLKGVGMSTAEFADQSLDDEPA